MQKKSKPGNWSDIQRSKVTQVEKEGDATTKTNKLV